MAQSSVLIPTCNLRVVVNRIGSFESKRLQQKMVDAVNGESIWVDIPEVLEDEVVTAPEERERGRRYHEWKAQSLRSS